jgi:arylsulfatase A-like enzyme
MRRREFIGGLAASASASALYPQAGATKPNIIFILADDLGYGDLGCYGQTKISTPNIDRLAVEGTKFTQVYAGSTVCAPSRCALMTGKHTGHTRIRGNAKVDLTPSDFTAAKLLQTAGYRTALIGKWGLGSSCSPGVPNKQGFDEFFGYLDQTHAHTYYPTSVWDNEKEYFLTGNFGINKKQYTPDLFTDRALNFVEKNKSNPFFLYLAYTIPHANNELNKESGNGMEVPSDAPYSDRDWPQPDKNFAAIVTRLDGYVGRLMTKLRETGLDRNTLVIFTSDNGPHKEGGNHPDFFASSGPLRGIKRDLYEGGIRVPAIARWPGVVPENRVSDQAWAFWDFLPSVADVAGVKPPNGLDGMSIMPALKGGALQKRDYFYWEFHEAGFSQAVRMGDWKGVRRQRRSNPIELYNLATDIGEKHDIAAQHPDIVKRIGEIMLNARTDSPEFPIHEATAKT